MKKERNISAKDRKTIAEAIHLLSVYDGITESFFDRNLLSSDLYKPLSKRASSIRKKLENI